MKNIARILPKTLCSIVLSLATMFMATASNASPEVSEKVYGGEFRLPLAGDPVTLDPARFSGIYAMSVANNLFDGLVKFNEDLRVVPAIAQIWKISRDRRTYSFVLRDGVRFHNGRKVTARDFVYSFTRILDPVIDSPAASLFSKIRGADAYRQGSSPKVEGLRVKDRNTLIIELEEPFAPFLSILAMANSKVVPKEAVDEDFGKNPVGTGAFRFAEWKSKQEIVLSANSDYFDGRPYLDTLRFRVYPGIDWETIHADFTAGLLDQSLVPGAEYSLKNSESGETSPHLVSLTGLNVVYIGMNLSLDIFKDARVRKAILYAVDRESIVQENARWRSVPAKGVVPPGIAGFDPKIQPYPYDPKKAAQLLAEAGYEGGQGLPPIAIWTVSKSKRVHNQLNKYREYLAAVGLDLVVKTATNWKDFLDRINNKQAAMFYAAWYADFPDADNFLYTLFHSSSRSNRMAYKNPEVDLLLEKARSEVDYLKRAEQYRRVERLVAADAPLIAQHYNSYNYVFQPWVKGINMNHLGMVYLPFREIWMQKPGRVRSTPAHKFVDTQ